MCGIVLVKAQATTQKGITMRLLLTAFLLNTLASLAGASTLNCSVEEFNYSSPATERDQGFVNANYNKTFMVTETDTNIVVTSISDQYENMQILYQIVNRNGMGYTYAIKVSPIDNSTISIGESNGFKVASIVNQMPGWAAIWMLRCN